MSNIVGVILGIYKVVGSSLGTVGSAVGSVLYDLKGLGRDDDASGASDQGGTKQEVFSANGLYSRPPKDEAEPTQVIAAQLGDEKVPIGINDKESLKRANAGATVPSMPAEGQRLLVGYGGAFISFQQKPGKADLVELYVPFDRGADGVPRKAHTIIIDPEGGPDGRIGIVHASGLSITMTTDDGIVMRADANTRMTLSPGRCEIIAADITLAGNVKAGPGALTGVVVPAATGALAPSSTVFISP